MKRVLQAFLLLASTDAFAPIQPTFGTVSSLKLSSSNEMSKSAIEEALEASKTFGPTSKEARVAWDIVEELNASDNSAAFTGGINDDTCATDNTSPECIAYEEKLAALSSLLMDQRAGIDSLKSLSEELRNVKLSKPVVSELKPEVPSMIQALNDAKALTDEFGIDSPQVKLAWEVVEDLASNDFSEATKASLDEECLVETIQACEAIEELQRALFVEERKVKGRYHG